MILVVGSESDGHVAPVVTELLRRGREVRVLDLADVPERVRVTALISDASPLRALVGDLDAEDVRTVWLRRIGTPRSSAQDSWFAVSETNQFLVGLAHCLRRKRWVNPLSALALDAGWGKLRQLQVARSVGLEIPETVATCDPAAALAFAEAHRRGGTIYKPFACPDRLWATDVSGLPPERFEAVRRAPGIFQERVPKAADLRVTVMGERVFACRIDSQIDTESIVDYRPRCFVLRREEHELPIDVELRLVDLHRELGLVHGTCDFVLTPDGRHVFLETNQSGCFLDVGAAPGVDLLGAFCDFLGEE